ncbi:putative nuclease HARBI1 [Leptopilina boulardi]|uniref:putative nuclease HARBI1 n=1 Tax=Leptopilina boulardi TaxID=63433 RepID=UPI0021F645B9|nr:putative nuclease HARBI1 [Leptopilina boulardi]
MRSGCACALISQSCLINRACFQSAKVNNGKFSKMANLNPEVNYVNAIGIVQNLVEMFFDDDDDDEEIIIFILNGKESHNKIVGYFEDVIAMYSLSDFKYHFRMSRNTFGVFLEILAPSLIGAMNGGLATVPIEKQLCIAMWYFANLEVYRSIADRFGVSQNTAWRCTIRIAKVLNRRSAEFIRWPQGQEIIKNQQEFFEIADFPDIIGAVDGCHIRINAPSENPESYVNRKGFHSLLLQGICDARMRFIDIYTGICGSVHDARVWTMSDISEAIEENIEEFCPRGSHIIGDSAYGIKPYLMTPYKDRGFMTPAQRNFNRILSRERVVIERAFCLLKGRCRRMKQLYLQNVKYGALIIAACCVVHNVCLDVEDEVNEDILREEDNIDDDDDGDNRGINVGANNVRANAEAKRLHLCEMFMAARRR